MAVSAALFINIQNIRRAEFRLIADLLTDKTSIAPAQQEQKTEFR